MVSMSVVMVKTKSNSIVARDILCLAFIYGKLHWGWNVYNDMWPPFEYINNFLPKNINNALDKINHFGVICIFFILHDHFVIAGIVNVSGYHNGTSQGTHTMQWYWTVHGYKCTHSPRSRHMRRTVLFILCVNRVKSSSLVISCGNTNPTLSQIACCTKKLA